jgi:uncharacterized caspase-like protein
MLPHTFRRAAPVVLSAAAVSLLALAPVSPPEPEGKKYALLVGINEYDHQDLLKLEYAVNDVTELRAVLAQAGYTVVLLTADEAKAKRDRSLAPTKANVEAQLKALVRQFKKGDTLLIALAGHGVQFEPKGDSYFCPVDARPFKDRTETLVSIGGIYDLLKKDAAAGPKLLLMDACRNDPDKGRGRGLDGEAVPTPPDGVGVLLSCSAGQRSFERDKYKHGVFFHHVLEGLKGEAKDRKGNVTWDSLRSYVKEQVARDEKNQTPEESGRLAGVPPVLVGPAVVSAAQLEAATSHLKTVGIAMFLQYSEARDGRFLPVASFDKQNKPLLSWRVHLLPHLGDEGVKLYKEFRLDEPWDSEHNKKLIAKMPEMYRPANPKLVAEGKTTFLAPVHKDAMFTGDKQGVRGQDVTDDPRQTILVVDVDDAAAVVWTKPEDLPLDPKDPHKNLSARYGDRYQFLFVDGSVRPVDKKIDRAKLWALFTRAGGEKVTVP